MGTLVDMIAIFFFTEATGTLWKSFWNVVVRNVISGENIVDKFDKVDSFGVNSGKVLESGLPNQSCC